MLRPRVFFLFLFLALTACATFEVVEVPLREADLYPVSQTQEAISVAVDEITSPERVRNYFGVSLLEQGILPVNIIVSNHGEHRVTVKPADVLLRRGTEVVDPLPIAWMAELAKRRAWRREETEEQINAFFSGLAFAETVLFPHDSYQGALFFPLDYESERDRFFSLIRLFEQGRLKLEVVVTDLETHQRIHFGPFSLSQ